MSYSAEDWKEGLKKILISGVRLEAGEIPQKEFNREVEFVLNMFTKEDPNFLNEIMHYLGGK